MNIPVTASAPFFAGQQVTIPGVGSYTVSSVPDGTHLTVLNSILRTNVAPGTVVSTSQGVCSGGPLSRDLRTIVPTHEWYFQESGAPFLDTGLIGGISLTAISGSGTPLAQSPGPFAYAVDLSSYLASPGAALSGGGGSAVMSIPMTLLVWFYLYASPGVAGIFGRASSMSSTGLGYDSFALFGNSGTLAISAANGATARSITTSNPQIPIGSWVCAMATWDGSTAQIGLNGDVISSTTLSGYPTTYAADPYYVGQQVNYGSPGLSGSGWPGKFGLARIYSVALTGAQFQAIYQTGLGRF